MSSPAITVTQLYAYRTANAHTYGNLLHGINLDGATFSVISKSDPELLPSVTVSNPPVTAANGTAIYNVAILVHYGTSNSSTTVPSPASFVLRVSKSGFGYTDYTFQVKFLPKVSSFPTAITNPTAKSAQNLGSFTLTRSDVYSPANTGVLEVSLSSPVIRVQRIDEGTLTVWTQGPTGLHASGLYVVLNSGNSATSVPNNINVTVSGTASSTAVSGSLSATFGKGVIYEIPYTGRATTTLNLGTLPQGLALSSVGYRHFITGIPTETGVFNSSGFQIAIAPDPPTIFSQPSSLQVVRTVPFSYTFISSIPGGVLTAESTDVPKTAGFDEDYYVLKAESTLTVSLTGQISAMTASVEIIVDGGYSYLQVELYSPTGGSFSLYNGEVFENLILADVPVTAFNNTASVGTWRLEVEDYYGFNVTLNSWSLNLTIPSADYPHPVTWSGLGLPPGLTMGSTTGILSGTTDTLFDYYQITVVATGGGGSTQIDVPLTISVFAPVFVEPPSSIGITRAFAFSYNLNNIISSTYTYSVTWAATGLPAGLTINSTTGVISGTTGAAVGNYPGTITATGGGGTTSLNVVFEVALFTSLTCLHFNDFRGNQVYDAANLTRTILNQGGKILNNSKIFTNSTGSAAFFPNSKTENYEPVYIRILSNTIYGQVESGTQFVGLADSFETPELNLAGDNFVIEAWVQLIDLPSGDSVSNSYPIYSSGNLNYRSFFFAIGSTTIRCFGNNDSNTPIISATYTFNLNTWTHVAVKRTGNTFRILVNGNVVATSTYTPDIFAEAGYYVGGDAPSLIGNNDYIPMTGQQHFPGFKGYMQGFRITKHFNLYPLDTGNTLPTTKLTTGSMKAMLPALSGNGPTHIISSGVYHNIGRSSIDISDNTGMRQSWIQLPMGDFSSLNNIKVTIEGWFKLEPGLNWGGSGPVNTNFVLQKIAAWNSTQSNGVWSIYVNNDLTLNIYDGSGQEKIGYISWQPETHIKIPAFHEWFYFSLTVATDTGLQNQTAYIHINGKLAKTITNWTSGGVTPGGTQVMRLMGDINSSGREYLDMYDYKFSLGIAKYDSNNYTPPTNTESNVIDEFVYYFINGVKNEYDLFKSKPETGGIITPPALPETPNLPWLELATGMVIINWEPISGATSYLVDLSTDYNFQSYTSIWNGGSFGAAIQNYPVTGTRLEVSVNTTGVTYYARVRSVNSSGTSDYSPFGAISDFNRYIPVNIVLNSTTSFTASWPDMRTFAQWAGNPPASIPGPYFITVSTNSDFSNPISGWNNKQLGTSTTFDGSEQTTGLAADTTYYIRVFYQSSTSPMAVGSNFVKTSFSAGLTSLAKKSAFPIPVSQVSTTSLAITTSQHNAVSLDNHRTTLTGSTSSPRNSSIVLSTNSAGSIHTIINNASYSHIIKQPDNSSIIKYLNSGKFVTLISNGTTWEPLVEGATSQSDYYNWLHNYWGLPPTRSTSAINTTINKLKGITSLRDCESVILNLGGGDVNTSNNGWKDGSSYDHPTRAKYHFEFRAQEETSGPQLSPGYVSQRSNSIGKFRSSIFFGGLGERVILPELDLRTGDFTLEFWMYCNTRGKKNSNSTWNSSEYNQTILYGGGSLEIRTDLSLTESFQLLQLKLYLGVLGNYTVSGGLDGQVVTNILANVWHHFALIRAGNLWKVYINGFNNFSFTSGIDLNSFSSWLIGSDGGGRHFNGFIDDFRITDSSNVYTAVDDAISVPTQEVSPLDTVQIFPQTFSITLSGNASTTQVIKITPVTRGTDTEVTFATSFNENGVGFPINEWITVDQFSGEVTLTIKTDLIPGNVQFHYVAITGGQRISGVMTLQFNSGLTLPELVIPQGGGKAEFSGTIAGTTEAVTIRASNGGVSGNSIELAFNGTRASFTGKVAPYLTDVVIRTTRPGSSGNIYLYFYEGDTIQDVINNYNYYGIELVSGDGDQIVEEYRWIQLTGGSGKSITTAISEWNSANPSNQVTLVSGNGSQVPLDGTLTLSGGGVPGAGQKILATIYATGIELDYIELNDLPAGLDWELSANSDTDAGQFEINMLGTPEDLGEFTSELTFYATNGQVFTNSVNIITNSEFYITPNQIINFVGRNLTGFQPAVSDQSLVGGWLPPVGLPTGVNQDLSTGLISGLATAQGSGSAILSVWKGLSTGFNGSIQGNILTVDYIWGSDDLYVGTSFYDNEKTVLPGTKIVEILTGSGREGTYRINLSQTVSGRNFTGFKTYTQAALPWNIEFQKIVLNDAVINISKNTQIQAVIPFSADTPVSWTLGNSNLPLGLTFNTTNATITGLTTDPTGQYNITVTAVAVLPQYNSDPKTYLINLSEGVISISDFLNGDGEVGELIEIDIAAEGSAPTGWLIYKPPGDLITPWNPGPFTVNSIGTVSGTPLNEGTYRLGVRAFIYSGPTFSGSISGNKITITNISGGSIFNGTEFYRISNGIIVEPAMKLLSGPNGAVGEYTIDNNLNISMTQFRAVTHSNTCTIVIDVTGDDGGGGPGGEFPPSVEDTEISSFTNQTFERTLVNIGGEITDWDYLSDIPGGVTISQVSGTLRISGTITTIGVYSFELTFSNLYGADNAIITIIITDGRPIIPENQSFKFIKNSVLTGTDRLTVQGNAPTSISFETLPSGVLFNPASYAFTGTAPSTTGETLHNVTATNLSGTTGAIPVKFIIADEAITITPNQVFDLTEGAGSFGRNIATIGGTPTGGSLEFAPSEVQLFFNPARLSGTIPPAGSYNMRVTLTNFGNSSTAFIQLNVSSLIPTITANQSFSGIVGTSAAFTVAFTGGTPTAWGIPTPTQLPPGITFSLSQGRFTGTPTAAGTFIVGIFAQNAAGTSPTVNVTITIAQSVVKPEIPAGQKFDLVAGQQVSNLFIQTTGGTPTAWAATGLPQGLNISTTTGQISGTLNAAATTTISNITASNSAGSSTQSVEFRITQPVVAPVITAGQTFTFILNTTITTDSRILFTGTEVTLTSQNLPSGVSVDGGTGRIQGRPLASGVFNATITARNSAGTDTKIVAITITSPTTQIPVLEQDLSPIQLVRNVNMPPYNFINSGGIATTWTASNLPQGLSFNFSTGTISGRPSVVENKTVTITATNSSGTATTTLAINVISSVASPVINNQTINAFRGVHFSFQLEATGTITNWLVDNIPNNSLPQGISLSAVIGTISGIPTTIGSFTTTIKVENESGNDTAVITIIVANSALIPVITAGQTFIGRKGVNFNYTIGFSNSGGTPTAWRLATTQTLLHPGITLDGRNGYLSGIPTAAGNTSTQLIASNSAGDSATTTVNFQITESVNAPNITQGQIFRATLNSAFSRNITFSGNVTEWRIVAGELPAGLTLNGSTGVISGTPTVYSGSRTIRIFAGNQDGSDEENITVAVDESAIVVSPGQSFNGYALDPFTATVRTEGNPVSWQLTNLPNSLGLTISNTGVISGTPEIAGEYTGVVTATGVSGISGSASIKINILSKVPVITPNQVISLSTANFITYSIAFSSVGGTPPTQWSALTPLPQGLTLNAVRGVISGTPAQATSTTGVDCDIKVENSYGASSEKIKIIVAAITSLLKINPEQSLVVNAGTPFEFTPTYVGVPTSWYILDIPTGLSINATTGKISGAISTAGTYRVCVYCENARFDASAFINITVS